MKTIKPSKQRKRLYKGKMHERKKGLTSHLSRELRKETGKRSMPAKTGDKVKIMRGTYKKQEGKIVKIDHKKSKIFIEKISRKKADGTEKLVPIKASNLLITEIDRKDEKRFKRTGIKAKKGKNPGKEAIKKELPEKEIKEKTAEENKEINTKTENKLNSGEGK